MEGVGKRDGGNERGSENEPRAKCGTRCHALLFSAPFRFAEWSHTNVLLYRSNFEANREPQAKRLELDR